MSVTGKELAKSIQTAADRIRQAQQAAAAAGAAARAEKPPTVPQAGQEPAKKGGQS